MDIASSIAQLFVVIGILVFMVNVIVQLTKTFIPIKTDLYVLIVSISVSVIGYFLYVSYSNLPITWYCVVAAIFAGFLVCYIAQNGWEKFIQLWEQSQKKDS